MAKTRSGVDNLREASVREALAVIEQSGVEALSLREVARRLGVSHQAPYRHFPSRDHLLAEVVRRTYEGFASHLDGRQHHDDPYDDLGSIGEAYLAYADAHPLQYRLMFATPLPDPEAHPDMMRSARHAFAILEDAVKRLPRPKTATAAPALDALYVWATVHGIASIRRSGAMATLDLDKAVHAAMQGHAMARLHTALMTPQPDTP
jgi:AcrR family transcriptional regulator